jgi:DNA segregation ATPase FtsK/SpoIIIE-like protein
LIISAIIIAVVERSRPREDGTMDRFSLQTPEQVGKGLAARVKTLLQRRMRIGFSRAARLIDMMERDGLLGPAQGSKPREVLVPQNYFDEIEDARVGVEE